MATKASGTQTTQPSHSDLPPIVQPAADEVPNTNPGVTYDSSGWTATAPADDQTAIKQKAALAKKVGSTHKNVFYDNDFSYLNDPAYDGWQFGDGLKGRSLPRGGWFDIGGQNRTRFQSEQNMRGLGLTGVDDKFILRRTRVYGDFHLSPDFRIYGEVLDADSYKEDFAPRPIEVNRTEIQNLFFDARLLASGDRSLTARVGRQEMQFGSQRLVSPLDWANTRRTFEGGRLMFKSKKRSVDAFWTNPMRIDDNSLDSPDRDQEFMGLHSSYKRGENQTVENYFFRLLNGRGANDFEYNTIGMRWQGTNDQFMWDAEGAYQFGTNTGGSSHVAGMATFGIGKKLSSRCWQPTLWTFYDWASGDDDSSPGSGFHHNFPLAHKYNGFMDLFGRRNLEDINVQLSLQPTKKLKLLAWYHYFLLESASDTPYSVVMTPFNAGNLPGSQDLGHEIDFVASYKLSPRQDVVLGYSHFFSGQYYDSTPGIAFNGDADFFYGQLTINF